MAEAHFHCLHGAAPGKTADKSGQKQQAAADHMAQQNGRQALRHTQRSQVGAREDFRDGHSGSKPDQAVV